MGKRLFLEHSRLVEVGLGLVDDGLAILLEDELPDGGKSTVVLLLGSARVAKGDGAGNQRTVVGTGRQLAGDLTLLCLDTLGYEGVTAQKTVETLAGESDGLL